MLFRDFHHWEKVYCHTWKVTIMKFRLPKFWCFWFLKTLLYRFLLQVVCEIFNFSLLPSFTESKFHLPYSFNTTLSLVLHSLFWLTPILSTSPSATSLIFSGPWWTASMQNVSGFVNVFSAVYDEKKKILCKLWQSD